MVTGIKQKMDNIRAYLAANPPHWDQINAEFAELLKQVSFDERTEQELKRTLESESRQDLPSEIQRVNQAISAYGTLARNLELVEAYTKNPEESREHVAEMVRNIEGSLAGIAQLNVQNAITARKLADFFTRISEILEGEARDVQS